VRRAEALALRGNPDDCFEELEALRQYIGSDESTCRTPAGRRAHAMRRT
jgi:hypothetical protein